MITFKTPKHHWNYYLAIEQDLNKVSRYIEFAKPNLGVYSIELAHILLSAASEVDVVLKQLCQIVAPSHKNDTINDYLTVLHPGLPNFSSEKITISRYGLDFIPWENWIKGKNPDWWLGYNRVKHQRDKHYHEASLQNALNAVGGLLLAVTYYYQQAFSQENGRAIDFKETNQQLQANPGFLSIDADYYYEFLIT